MSDFDEMSDASSAEETFSGSPAVLHADALDDTLAVLNPAEPVCLPASATIAEATQAMLGRLDVLLGRHLADLDARIAELEGLRAEIRSYRERVLGRTRAASAGAPPGGGSR